MYSQFSSGDKNRIPIRCAGVEQDSGVLGVAVDHHQPRSRLIDVILQAAIQGATQAFIVNSQAPILAIVSNFTKNSLSAVAASLPTSLQDRAKSFQGSLLQTTYLAYILSNVVKTLALQLQVEEQHNEDFGLVPTSHIVAVFALSSLVDPNTFAGENSQGKNKQSNAKGRSAQTKTQQDFAHKPWICTPPLAPKFLLL
ncbi:hypothetical protein C8J57DRAFT_1234254 [Mycena rebaudengoi]|nr:hypothetical protein C8J57DRAFT_1234254 [Mycena rebaudengoi]